MLFDDKVILEFLKYCIILFFAFFSLILLRRITSLFSSLISFFSNLSAMTLHSRAWFISLSRIEKCSIILADFRSNEIVLQVSVLQMFIS